MESVTPEKFEYLPEDLETIKSFMESLYLHKVRSSSLNIGWGDLLDEEYTEVLNYCMDK